MIYINPQNEYPRFYGDIQLENPDWNLGDPLPEGWIEISMTPPPLVGEGEVLEELAPVDNAQVWNVRPMTEEELAASNSHLSARAKLKALKFTDAEIDALARGLRP